MKKIMITDKIISGLRRFIPNEKIPPFQFPKIAGEMVWQVIPSGMDVYLTEYQYDAVLSIEKTRLPLYIIMFDEYESLYRENRLVLMLEYPYQYSEYENVYNEALSVTFALEPEYANFFSDFVFQRSVVFNDSFEWIVLIEEDAQGSVGYFISTPEIVSSFKKNYTMYDHDERECVEFYLKHFGKVGDFPKRSIPTL